MNSIENPKNLAVESLRNLFHSGSFEPVVFDSDCLYLLKKMSNTTKKGISAKKSNAKSEAKALKALQVINEFNEKWESKRVKAILWDMLFASITSDNHGYDCADRTDQMFLHKELRKLVSSIKYLKTNTINV